MICKHCGAQFEGNFCPNCGAKYGMTQKEQIGRQKAVNRQLNKSTARSCLSLFIIVFGIAVIIVVGLNIFISGGNKDSEIVGSRPTSSAHLSAYSKQLSSGHYIVGMDIPAGTYDIKAVKGRGNVYSTNAYKGGLNEIMGTSSNDVQSFDNCELPKGTILSVLGVKVSIKSDAADINGMQKRENPATKSVTLMPGNYIAGTDFAAGTYDIKAASGAGNVYSDNTERGINAIMGTKSDEIYEKEFLGVLLEDGTKITISGVTVHLNPSK